MLYLAIGAAGGFWLEWYWLLAITIPLTVWVYMTGRSIRTLGSAIGPETMGHFRITTFFGLISMIGMAWGIFLGL